MFSFISNSARHLSVKRIANIAISKEAFSPNGVFSVFSEGKVFEMYFQKYGTTERKYDFHPISGIAIGYVQMPETEEFLSSVTIRKNGNVMRSYVAPETGEDLLGLIAKKAFADQILLNLSANIELEE